MYSDNNNEVIILTLKNMTTIIFKSEKNAKIYSILSNNNNGIYEIGEEIMKVKTDNIKFYMKDYENYIALCNE